MEKKIFKPKLRCTLLDEDGTTIEDRLVDQATEFTMGPKKSHTGPTRFEVTLQNQHDIDQFKAYIDKLRSNLPVKEMNSRGRPAASSTNALLESPREDILVKVEQMVKEGLNQHDIIKYLRTMGFIFLLTEDFLRYFPEFEFNKKDIGEPNSSSQYPKSYSWMVRCIKMAKDPKSDKYDKMILFGFQIIEERTNKIIPYLYGDRKKPLRAPVEKKNPVTFNGIKELTKFPHYMEEEERLKFSTEMRLLTQNKDRKPSKFFIRWYKDIKFPKEMQPIIEEVLER